MSSIMRWRSGLIVLVSLMESSILSEVDDTSILRTGLPTPLWLSSQLATGLSPLAQRSGLERSDFAPCPLRDFRGRANKRPHRVESGCGAVAVGWACLFPPLSSGGALVARP